MRDPLMEDLIDAIEEGSPLAGAVDSLLAEGLAVDDVELDAAAEALLARIESEPRRAWMPWLLPPLALAAAAGAGLIAWGVEGSGERVAVTEEPAPAAAVGGAPARSPSLARPARGPVADAERCLEVLRAGDLDRGLPLLEQLARSGALDEAALRGLVTTAHELALGMSTEDPARERILRTTMVGYAAWLGRHGDDPRAGAMHFAYAELLSETQRLDEAYVHYGAVVLHPADPKQAYRAAESAVRAAEQVVRRQAEEGSHPTDPAPGATEWEEKLVLAVDQALAHDPDRADAASMSYKAGFTLYATGEHERAIGWFQDVMDRDPYGEQAKLASHLIMDSFSQREDWLGLEAWALALHEDETVGDAHDREQAWSIASRAGRAALEAEGRADGWLAWLDRYGVDAEVVERAIAALRAEGRDAEADALSAP